MSHSTLNTGKANTGRVGHPRHNSTATHQNGPTVHSTQSSSRYASLGTVGARYRGEEPVDRNCTKPHTGEQDYTPSQSKAKDPNDGRLIAPQSKYCQPVLTGSAPSNIRAALRRDIAAAPWRHNNQPEPTIGDGSYRYLEGHGPSGMSIYVIFCNLEDGYLTCFECGHKSDKKDPLPGALDHQRHRHHFHNVP